MPVLSNIKIVVDGFQLRLIATDIDTTMETLVNAEIEEGGNGVLLPAQRLYDTVAALSGSKITVKISDTFRTTIETGAAKYQLIGMDVADYPIRADNAEPKVLLSIPTTRFRALIDSVQYATSKDQFRPAMMGVLLQVQETGLRTVATDGFRMATRKETFTEPITEKSIDVILSPDPLKAGLKHIAEENVSIELSATTAVIRDSITTVVMRIIDEIFPNWQSVIPTSNDSTLTLRGDDLLATLKRVLLYSNFQTKQVRLNLMGDQFESSLTMMAEDNDTGGEAKESVPIQYNGEKMEIGLNGPFLREVLNHIDSDEVELRISTPLRPILLYPSKQEENSEYFHLLMPVRLSE